MALDGIALSAVTEEMQQLVNSRVTKIYQPERRDVVLHCRQPGVSLPVVLSADTHNARACLATSVPKNPPYPPSFCMLLRKYLEGGRIVRVVQPDLERILEVTIENIAEHGGLAEFRLIAEMMGRHSNIVLVDGSNTILDAIVRVDSRINRYREILPGIPYLAPPTQDKISPVGLEWQRFASRMAPAHDNARLWRLLLDNIQGIGPQTAKELVHRAGYKIQALRGDVDGQGLERLFAVVEELGETVIQKAFAPQLILDSEGNPHETSAIPITHLDKPSQRFKSMSEALELCYDTKITQHKISSARHNLNKVIEGHLGRVARKRQAQQRALEQAEAADTYRILGELLTANLYRVEKGMTTITVPNFYDENQAEMDIPLDPRLTPSGNAQEYFRRYNRAKKTKIAGLYQLRRSLAEEQYLEQVQATLELAADLDELSEIRRELINEGYVKSVKQETRKKQAPVLSQPHGFRSRDGFDIFVGRNNRQNDYVTFKVARPDDIWLHVKDIPGSHVVIKAQGKEVPEMTLLDAALLAAYFSKARNGENVPVDYTQRKHVRKPKGAKPGMVIYDHQTTLFVSPDPAKIMAIKKQAFSKSE